MIAQIYQISKEVRAYFIHPLILKLYFPLNLME